MTMTEHHKLAVLAALLAGLALVLIPMLAHGGAYTGTAGYEGYHGWMDRLTNEVLIARADADDPGKVEPYLGQLQVVRTALLLEDEAAVYKGMNRLMDMLEARVTGISGTVADRIFDYCYEVTPAKFHDVSRHFDNYDPDRWWQEMIYHDQ